MIQRDDRVWVRGAKGTVVARVATTVKPEDLEDIPGAPKARAVTAILQEAGVDFLALLLYPFMDRPDKEIAFVALHGPSGWRDQKGAPLEIEPYV